MEVVSSPFGLIDLSRQELHVPLAHQSALAGVLLAGALVRRAVGKRAEATITTRIDINMILEAERSGALRPGGTVIEASQVA